ncbi:hypothetical protein CLOP_g17413 [Closterium sp. NIES-67]|nr:hypothetical protein CLOP_g17413 [Closterium sp. NIES-67]
MATGQVLLHRFYCKKSLTRFNVKGVAASCVWLASKLEENPRRIRDVLNVFHRINLRRDSLPLPPLEQFSKNYEDLRTELIRTERHILKEMGFICHVEHPHKFIFNYLRQLDVLDDAVKHEAWNLANDSLRTVLCVRFKSEVVACGVIYAATRERDRDGDKDRDGDRDREVERDRPFRDDGRRNREPYGVSGRGSGRGRHPIARERERDFAASKDKHRRR